MATQSEVEAGQQVVDEWVEKYVPVMFQSQFAPDMRFNLALAIIEAAEKARKQKLE